MENFEAQRAAIMAELTQAALTGGDTFKTREKLARLEEREAQAAQAEQQRQQAQRQQADTNAATRAVELADEAIERLRAGGIEVADTDAHTLQTYARMAARHEAEIQTAGDAYLLAQSKVQQVQDRIAALSERAAALYGLRVTGQATDRDTGEAVLVERDLQTLREALTQAQAVLVRAQVPADMQRQHQAALAAMHAQERDITLRCLHGRAKAAEAAFMLALRELVATSGVAHPSQAFTRDPALDRFVNFGVL